MKKIAKIISLTLAFIFTSLILSACVPASVDDAINKMEKAGYVVNESVITSYEQTSGVIGKIKAQKLDDGDLKTIIALFFESEDKAKAFYETSGGWHDSVLTKTNQEGRWAYAANSDDTIKDFKK